MSRINKKWLMAAITAICLALFLTGCASPGDDGSRHESDSSSFSPEDDGFGHESNSGGSGHEGAAPADILTLPSDILEVESKEISEEDNEKIQRALNDLENLFFAAPDGVEVKQREWSRYSSLLGKEALTDAEAAFYDRLDAYCLEYLTSTSLSGVKHDLIEDEYRLGKEVSYADLGLTHEEAGDIYGWFLYNCPQYYFFRAGYVHTTSSIRPYIYARWSDGSERAEVTNELFDKLDGWVDLVGENTGTTFQKEFVANSYICDTVTYDYESIKEGHESEAWFNQSLYTAVVPEHTICAGYSKLFTAMMNALDVPVTVGLGKGHAWNVIRLDDGNYYCVDTCWNAAGNDKTGYLNVGDAASKAGDNGKESHVYREPEMKWIPAISASNYQPTEYDTTGKEVHVDTPSGVQITLLNDGEHDNGLDIRWNDVPGVSEYEFAIFEDSRHSQVLESSNGKLTWNIDSPNMNVWNLKPEKTYYYGVRAKKTEGGRDYYSDWNYFFERLDSVQNEEITLAKPTGLAAAPNQEDPDTKVRVTWDAVDGADGYEFVLYQDGTHDEVWKTFSVTSPNIGMKDLNIERTYYYGVRAVKTTDDGDYSSNLAYGSICLKDLASGDGQLSKPGNYAVILDPEDPESCVFSCDAVLGAEYYQFAHFTDGTYQTIEKGSSSGDLYSWEKNDPWISIGPFKSGETCYSGVRAVKTVDGEKTYSDWAYLTFQFDDLTGGQDQLDKPENFTFSKSKEESDGGSLSWDTVQGADQYQLARFTDETYQTISVTSGEIHLLLSWNTENTSSHLSPLYVNQTYYYGVRAVKTVDGEKMFSDWTYISFTFK